MVEQAPSQVPPTSTIGAEEITQRLDEPAFKLYKPTSPQPGQTPGVCCVLPVLTKPPHWRFEQPNYLIRTLPLRLQI